MKILVFEYICGGGMAGQTPPASLLAEASMMLQALVNDLKCLDYVQLIIPLDEVCTGLNLPDNAKIIPIDAAQDIMQLLPKLLQQCDAIWPIAPETDGILANIAEIATRQRKKLLLSSVEAVLLCGDKYATYRQLLKHGIPLVETCLLEDFNYQAGSCVLKLRDGIGCQGHVIISSLETLQAVVDDLSSPSQYLVQPYCTGEALSLSCLCKDGKAWLLCCNRQQIRLENKRFILTGCHVNVPAKSISYYQNLVAQIAAAIPGLWGYIGIDLLETAERGSLVLEINPRLTTSYVGIKAALGLNVAEQVIALMDSEPALLRTRNDVAEIVIP